MLKLPGNLFGRFDFDECWIKKIPDNARFCINKDSDPYTILLPVHAHMDENGWFKDHAERGTRVRFMYVIDHNADLVQG